MAAPLLVAGLSAGAGLFGQAFNAYSTGKMNKRAEDFAWRMHAQQRADHWQDLDYSNTYNSPTSQMNRLKDAGLNPHLVYGHGQATQPSAPSRGANVSAPNFKAPQVDAGSVVFNALQAKQMQSNIAHTDAQTELLRSQKTGVDYKNQVFTPEKLAEELNTKIRGFKMSADLSDVNADIRQLELDNLNLISGNYVGSTRNVGGSNPARLNGIEEKFNAEMTKLNQTNQKLGHEVSIAEAEKLLRKYQADVIDTLGVDRGTAVNIVQNLLKMFFMSYTSKR